MVALPTYSAEHIDFYVKKDVEYTSVVFKIKKRGQIWSKRLFHHAKSTVYFTGDHPLNHSFE